MVSIIRHMTESTSALRTLNMYKTLQVSQHAYQRHAFVY